MCATTFTPEMPDIIQLLPDSVANQIAAGEVIQRPASAVKELLENSIDAGSTSINVIIKDAGRTLIRITDNGCGMSPTDARMSFERHATSKIRKVNDLFSVRTFGFRGEALASVASIAHVEMKTKRAEDEAGTLLIIEGSEVKSQEASACPNGTTISVKNLFYNVPARRNFLKSNNVEMKHIIEEFQRSALAFPEIAFTLSHNGHELFHLSQSSTRQRIVGIFGHSYNEHLVPVKEDTSIINLGGFAGKPEFAKKTRGEQFFFVNRRFIKDAYLNHAVQSAYEQLLPQGSYPSYFLFIEIDPSKIDVNIHPTKTEIKFEEEKALYAIIRSAVKGALGQYSLGNSLDFDQEASFSIPAQPGQMPVKPSIKFNPEYNPFRPAAASSRPATSTRENWQEFYKGMAEALPGQTETFMDEKDLHAGSQVLQVNNSYIVYTTEKGIAVIDQQSAHEKILYEKFMDTFLKGTPASQQQLFPKALEFSASDSELLKEIEPQLRNLGFDIRAFGKNTFVVHGIPSHAPEGEEKQILESILEKYKENPGDLTGKNHETLAASLAKRLAVKRGTLLREEKMKAIAGGLFSCSNPQTSPSGRPVFVLLPYDELRKKFGN